MATRVTVTKWEHAALKYVIEISEKVTTHKTHVKHIMKLKNLLEKVDNRAAIPPPSGLSFASFHAVLFHKLGKRLALPPNPSPAWYAMQTNRIKSTGIDKEQARLVAIGASMMRYPAIIPFELIVHRITGLLAEGQRCAERSVNSDAESPVGFGREEDDLDD